MGDVYLTPGQMQYAEQSCGVPLDILMDNAGAALAERIKDICYRKMKKNVLFLCGKGNNAGDGFVAASILEQCGIQPTVLLCCGEPKTELAKAAFEKLCAVETIRYGHDEIKDLPDLLQRFDVIADCVFGTGFSGELPQEIADMCAYADASGAYKIACDVPSGVNALTGEAVYAFKADETLTMHMPKIGCALSPARELCGEVISADIGIDIHGGGIQKFDRTEAVKALPHRLPHGHKGTFGKVVCICGSAKYTGAAAMSVKAALRSGAGLVELCSTKTVIDRLCPTIHEAIYTELPCTAEGFVSAEGIDMICKEMQSADAVLFGCGMGNTEDTRLLLEAVIKHAGCPVVIDADGINSLCANIDILKSKHSQIIVTPHPMELARLCGMPCVPCDRYGAAKELSDKYGITVMAKGAQTFVVSENESYICRKGNTALSKGGSGDMLSGLTAGFLAQGAKPGISAENACCLASFVLGDTAERLCEKMSPRGIIAGDILNELPKTLFNLEN